MRVYPYWLEGTNRRILIDLGNASWQLNDSAQHVLKLHAFFGNTVGLSEIEVTDGPPLWEMFRDHGFRTFLQQEDEFLALHAFLRGDPAEVPRDTVPWRCAIEGPKTALHFRQCSTPEIKDAPSAPEFFGHLEELVNLGALGDFERLRKRWAEQKVPNLDELEGLSRTVEYFAGHPTHVSHVERRSSYDEVLVRALNLPVGRFGGDDRRHVEWILDELVSRVEDPKERRKRTPVGNQLKKAVPKERAAWATINHAWSVAVQDSVCEEGHVGRFASGVEVGLYLHDPIDTLFAASRGGKTDAAGDTSLLEKVVKYPLDPGLLPWRQLADLMAATADERHELQRALPRGNHEEIGERLRKLAVGAANVMPGGPQEHRFAAASVSLLALAGYLLALGPGWEAVLGALPRGFAGAGVLLGAEPARVRVMEAWRRTKVTTRIKRLGKQLLQPHKWTDRMPEPSDSKQPGQP